MRLPDICLLQYQFEISLFWVTLGSKPLVREPGTTRWCNLTKYLATIFFLVVMYFTKISTFFWPAWTVTTNCYCMQSVWLPTKPTLFSFYFLYVFIFSENFSEAGSARIVGFRGMWSLRNSWFLFPINIVVFLYADIICIRCWSLFAWRNSKYWMEQVPLQKIKSSLNGWRYFNFWPWSAWVSSELKQRFAISTSNIESTAPTPTMSLFYLIPVGSVNT